MIGQGEIGQGEIGRSEIARLLPHAGSMVLLDRVASWSETEIECRTESHGDPGNPLRRDGRLPVICGVEYGAQAMAVHGALLAGTEARPGRLASLRKVTWSVERLDRLAGALAVRARVLMSEPNSSIYAFSLLGEGEEVMAGQAAVFLL